MIQDNADIFDSEAWVLCEKCDEQLEGRDGHEVMERLARHRIERHSDPDLVGTFVSPYLAGDLRAGS